jgi:hypothetical protein
VPGRDEEDITPIAMPILRPASDGRVTRKRSDFSPRDRRSSQTRGVTYGALVRLGAVIAVMLLFSSARADAPASDLGAASEVIDASHGLGATVGATTLGAMTSSEAVLEDHVRAGQNWRLDTGRGAVRVWAPADYDAATAATVMFVHGYWIDVDEAWASYRLPQQFALSGINALFIVAEAPSTKWDPLAWPSLGELVRTVADRVAVAMPERLVAVGHSGAYRTLASWLANPALDTIVMLDALYVEYGLLPWLRASRQHRLINIVYETSRFSDFLHRRLPSTHRVDGLPPDGLPDARILHVRTDVGHWELVTDGVALPLALRAIGIPRVASAPVDMPLGLVPRCDPPPTSTGFARPPFAPWITELAP